MLTYKAPLRDMKYLLDVFGHDKVLDYDIFDDFDSQTVNLLLETVADMSTKELLPLNKKGDEEGLKFNPETGEVTTPEGFREAYQKLVQNGLIGISGPTEYGGAGGPETLGVFFSEISVSTNKSFSMCPGLTRGLVDALIDHGSEQQKNDWLPKLVTGEWTGTMCLTEPQCGTDLGLITTKAEPTDEEGTYKLTGNKIWITFGEHDMADNIVHFVLARLPGAPEGTRGISTFIVPKVTLDGRRNSINCTGLEHKLGIHASPTCVMALEEAEGYLVGAPNKGMRAMFTMMNIARLHVGIEGIALAEIAYQTALAFAKERRQSRSLNPDRNEEDKQADNILVHPDVRRMLLNIKSTTEGMRALALWIATEHVHSLNLDDEKAAQQAHDMVALLTPIIKSYGSERGFENISEAMQVCGGAGYTTDWYIEQYMRDERIAMIYEGTNHIQALDLVGRKLTRENGRMFQAFNTRITQLLRATKEDDAISDFRDALKVRSKQLQEVTMGLAGTAMQDREIVGAVANNYLNLFALTALTYCWVKMAKHAAENPDDSLSATKLKTGRYFLTHVLPEADSYAALVKAGKGNIMEFDVDEL